MKEISCQAALQEKRLDAEFFLNEDAQDGLLLKDIAKKIIAGSTPRHFKNDYSGINFYTVEDIKKLQINTPKRKILKNQKNTSSRIEKGDILLTIKGRIGDAAVVEEEKGCINQNIARISLKDDYDPYATAAVINSEKCKKNLNRIATNQQNPYIRITQLKSITIKYPKKDIEEKITKKIKMLVKIKKQKAKESDKINRIFNTEKEKITQLNVSFKNVLEEKRMDAEYFKFAKNKKWEDITLKEIKSTVKIGNYTAQYVTRGAPYIKGQCIRENKIERPETKVVKGKNYLLQKNDILLLRVGSIGKCAIVTEREEGWVASDNFLIVRNLENEINTETLLAFFLSDRGREILKRSSQGSKQRRLNKKTVENLKIPQPPTQIQKKIKHLIQSLVKMESSKRKLEQEINRLINIEI